ATYVERRQKLGEGAALVGAGKRAAFALFYGPLHFLLVSHIVRQLPGATRGITTLLDLGCGTGASGAAWASHCEPPPRLVAIGRHPWAVAEAAHICRAFGVKAATRRADVAAIKWPIERAAILAAFTVNELSDESRSALRDRLLERAARGDRVLVVEPIAGFVARWWNGWRDGFEGARGRAPAGGGHGRAAGPGAAAGNRGEARSRGGDESRRDYRTFVVDRITVRLKPDRTGDHEGPARTSVPGFSRAVTATTRANAPSPSN